MTDSEDEPQLGQGHRIKTPSKDRQEHAQIASKRDTAEVKATIKKKRTARIESSSPAPPPNSRPMAIEPQAMDLQQPKTPTKNTADKGKGKAKASLAAQMRQLLSPINEAEDFPSPFKPGPKPQFDCDDALHKLEVDEWKHQRLLWFLCHHDNRIFDPHSDYEDLKSILGDDQRWDSDDDSLDNKILAQGQPSTTTGCATMGQFDEEPPKRKPVPVKSVACEGTTGTQDSKSQKQPGRTSQASTSIGKRKMPEPSHESPDFNQKTSASNASGPQNPKRQKSNGLVIQKTGVNTAQSQPEIGRLLDKLQ
ncbi:hypothetical protein FRC11_008371, partial [Ceratobasidium sp. 423]